MSIPKIVWVCLWLSFQLLLQATPMANFWKHPLNLHPPRPPNKQEDAPTREAVNSFFHKSGIFPMVVPKSKAPNKTLTMSSVNDLEEQRTPWAYQELELQFAPNMVVKMDMGYSKRYGKRTTCQTSWLISRSHGSPYDTPWKLARRGRNKENLWGTQMTPTKSRRTTHV